MSHRCVLLAAVVLLGGCTTVRHCDPIPVAPGPESFALQRGTGGDRLIIATQERRGERPPGAIYALPLPRAAATELRLEGRPADRTPFHPLAVSVQGNRAYILLRHDDEPDFFRGIEIYDLGAETLTWVGAIDNDTVDGRPALENPNGLFVDADGTVFVSNDSRSRGFRNQLQMLFRTVKGSLVAHDGTSWRRLDDDLRFANGIVADDRHLYLAEYYGRRIIGYRRDGANLVRESTINLPCYPDNLSWEDADTIDVACHPNAVAIGLHLLAPIFRAPSDAYAIDVSAADPTPRLLYRVPGRFFSAGSQALVHGSRVYAGQIVDGEILVCDLP